MSPNPPTKSADIRSLTDKVRRRDRRVSSLKAEIAKLRETIRIQDTMISGNRQSPEYRELVHKCGERDAILFLFLEGRESEARDVMAGTESYPGSRSGQFADRLVVAHSSDPAAVAEAAERLAASRARVAAAPSGRGYAAYKTASGSHEERLAVARAEAARVREQEWNCEAAG